MKLRSSMPDAATVGETGAAAKSDSSLRVRYPWSALLLMAIGSLGCDRDGISRQGDQVYRGLQVNTSDHRIELLPQAESSMTKRESPLGGIELTLRDGEQSRTDTVHARDGKIIEWISFKEFLEIPGGSLIFQQRFSTDYPNGNPWPTFSLGKGEKGVPMSPNSSALALEAIYLCYVYEGGESLAAIYGKEGGLLQIATWTKGNVGYWHRASNPAGARQLYALPDPLDLTPGPPLVNEALRSGLARLKQNPAPESSRLLAAARISQYGQGSIFHLVGFDIEGRSLDHWSKYPSRPYDAAAVSSLQGRK